MWFSESVASSDTLAENHSGLVLMFWHVGKRVNDFVLKNQRAEYGKQIVVTLSRQLLMKYGNNFEEKNFRRMLQFANEFQDFENVVTLSRHLSWSHFLAIIPLKTSEKQQFYAGQAAGQAWGVRELRKQIKNKVFERTEIANSQLLPEKNDMRDIFKDPYFLNSLGIKDGYLEKDLENAILKDIEEFILEIGKGFAFIERQKRMIIDGKDFYLDLLFFHRKLKRLVAIELKIDEFQAKYKGQMELYLKWLNKYERQEGENEPIGLILCAETSREQVELLEMHKDGIIVAEYWTELPPRDKLEEKLQIALQEARERIERKKWQWFSEGVASSDTLAEKECFGLAGASLQATPSLKNRMLWFSGGVASSDTLAENTKEKSSK